MKKPQDDRGVRCSIAKLSAHQLGWRTLGLKSVTRNAITKGEQKITERRETAIALVGGFIGYLCWEIFIQPMTKPHVGMFLDIVLHVVFAICIAMLLWYFMLGWIREAEFERISEFYLSHGNCASCGYLLDDLTQEADGCVVCPECNSAWQSSRLKTVDKIDQPK